MIVFAIDESRSPLSGEDERRTTWEVARLPHPHEAQQTEIGVQRSVYGAHCSVAARDGLHQEPYKAAGSDTRYLLPFLHPAAWMCGPATS